MDRLHLEKICFIIKDKAQVQGGVVWMRHGFLFFKFWCVFSVLHNILFMRNEAVFSLVILLFWEWQNIWNKQKPIMPHKSGIFLLILASLDFTRTFRHQDVFPLLSRGDGLPLIRWLEGRNQWDQSHCPAGGDTGVRGYLWRNCATFWEPPQWHSREPPFLH